MQMMSIGGNCANLSILGEMRVPGPVDNWSTQHGFADVPCLFEDFKDVVSAGPVEILPHPKGFPTDCDKRYRYKHYQAVHLYMDNPEVVSKVFARHDKFLAFIERVKTEPDCYFIYTLNENDVERRNGKWMPKDHFLPTARKLEVYFPLNKLIFIGTVKDKCGGGCFCAHTEEFPEELNYIDLTDIRHFKSEMTEVYLRKIASKLASFASTPPHPKHEFFVRRPQKVIQDDWED